MPRIRLPRHCWANPPNRSRQERIKMQNIIIGLVIAALIAIYMWLRKSIHREENLPAVSEDVNLPAKPEGNFEALNPKSETNPENPKI